MPPKKRKQGAKPPREKSYTLSPTETEAGVVWLNTLTEDIFRDKILAHLFRKMQKTGLLHWFENIHGRNDKGVDYLLVFTAGFGRRIIGIQAKSAKIIRSDDGGGAVRIQQECVAAMTEEFNVQGNKSRLDNIELWCSAHITQDAEQVFYAPAAPIKIQIKKAPDIFTLIETHAPDLLRTVPQCALTLYVKDKMNPQPKRLKLLGCELNAKKHFLEPQFSRVNFNSSASLKTENNVLRKRNTTTAQFSDILFEPHHSVLLAPELSGKTYLLEHGEALVAESQAVPIFLTKEDFPSKTTSINAVIARKLKIYSEREVEALAENVKIFLLVDNIDSISHEIRSTLFSQNPSKIKIVATARSLTPPDHVQTFYMTGVNLGSITKFLRSLDVNLSQSKPFLDRAHSFIDRTLATSGLPSTPFTISVMLGECQNSTQRFNTPTMGRLIERFVEMQLGSHSDNETLVDFETKREFLAKLAGRAESTIPLAEFRRELMKFIESRSHPHTLEHFLTDLRNSGLFTFTPESVTWSHPVIKQFYWVKSLVAKNRLNPIIKKLRERDNITLAALVGSQIKDAGLIIEKLIPDLEHIRLPSRDKMAASVDKVRGALWKSDEDEDAWLNELEKLGNSGGRLNALAQAVDEANLDSKPETPQGDETITVDVQTIAMMRKRLEPMMRQLVDSKLHIAFNLAAMLVNARDTKANKKSSTIRRIIACNKFLADWFLNIITLIIPEGKDVPLDFKVVRLTHLLTTTDRMVGDPFFINVFKSLLKDAKNDDEVLVLLDLVLSCGEDDHNFILKQLKRIKRSEVSYAFYLRVATLYFFRFHREHDRRALRTLLQDIRKTEQVIQLPHIK